MFFSDLTPYTYHLPFSFDNVQCVGWLDSFHSYNHGIVPPVVLERLKSIIEKCTSTFDAHVNVVRGIHPCNLCGNEVTLCDGNGSKSILGMSELWIPFQAGYFAAPSLVWHYIADHEYCPPEGFIHSILELSLDQTFVGQDVYDGLMSEVMTKRQIGSFL